MNEQCSWEVRLCRSLVPLRSSNWNKFNSVKYAFIFILLPLCVHPPPLEQKSAVLTAMNTVQGSHKCSSVPGVSFYPLAFHLPPILCSQAKSIKLNRSCSSRFSVSLSSDKKKKNGLWNQRGSLNGCPPGSCHPPLHLTHSHWCSHPPLCCRQVSTLLPHAWRLCQSHGGVDSQASAPLWTFRTLFHAHILANIQTHTHWHTQFTVCFTLQQITYFIILIYPQLNIKCFHRTLCETSVVKNSYRKIDEFVFLLIELSKPVVIQGGCSWTYRHSSTFQTQKQTERKISFNEVLKDKSNEVEKKTMNNDLLYRLPLQLLELYLDLSATHSFPATSSVFDLDL